MMSLDDDLAAWAATVRLPDAEAAAIFRRIAGPPAPVPATPVPVPATPVPVPATPAPVPAATPRLDPSWWRHFTADYTARMIASTRPARLAA